MERIKTILSKNYIMFLIAFIIMFVALIPLKDLMGGGGDSYETVEVIKSFFSSNKYISYVMYKGIYAFIPGMICYNIGNLLNINWIWIMKIFHSLCFAYITSIGLPYLIEFLIKNKIKTYQKYILIILYFILENAYFTFISVDFMSMVILLLGINAIIRIKNKEKINIWNCLYIGIILGICTCLSGQYTLSAILLIMYIIYQICKISNKNFLKLTFICIFIIGMLLTKSLDKIYSIKVIEPARKAGYWLPTGEEWIRSGFTSNMRIINYPTSIPDYLGKTIIKSENLDEEAIANGAAFYDEKGIVKTIFKYPIIFIMRWCERLFLGVMNDPYNMYPASIFDLNQMLILLIMGTFIYISFLVFKEKNKTIKDILSLRTIIIISFILSSLIPCFYHSENRYFIAIRSLIITTAITKIDIKKIFKIEKNKNIKNQKINYNTLIYFLFIIMIFIIYVAIYQSAGIEIITKNEIFK